VRLTDLHITSQ